MAGKPRFPTLWEVPNDLWDRIRPILDAHLKTEADYAALLPENLTAQQITAAVRAKAP